MRRLFGPLTFIAVLVVSSVAHAGPEVMTYHFVWQVYAEASQVRYDPSRGYYLVSNGPFELEAAAEGLVTEIPLGVESPDAIWLYFQFFDGSGNALGALVLAPGYGSAGLSLHDLRKQKDPTQYTVVYGQIPIPEGLFANMDVGTPQLQGGVFTFAPKARTFTVGYSEGAHSNTFGVNYYMRLDGEGELTHGKSQK